MTPDESKALDIVLEFDKEHPCDWPALVLKIQAAIREERERCAKIAEQIAADKEDDAANEEDAEYKRLSRLYAKHIRRVAAAIRSNGTPPTDE